MDEQKKSRGLAGLSSMVTDVHAIEQQAKKQTVHTQTRVRDDGAPQTTQSSRETAFDQSPQYQKELSNRGKQAKKRDRLIALGLGLVLLFCFFKAYISSSSSQQTRMNTTNHSNVNF